MANNHKVEKLINKISCDTEKLNWLITHNIDKDYYGATQLSLIKKIKNNAILLEQTLDKH